MANVPIGPAGADVTAFPFVLILGQDDNERIMGRKLHELGVDVQWNTELTALDQSPGHVDVTLGKPDDASRRLLARVGVGKPSFYLLRPDGHIGLAGMRLDRDAVWGYFSKWHIDTT